ncbi:MAG: hypothetical protein HPY66_2407 [Firmicutes bacterium]|nr:hypothetical protein [Bacillota bacterium]MDI6707034.1 hypothetical protein [Bacillota bacterium]
MNAFILLIPMLLIQYGLLNIVGREAARRARFFPPVEGKERLAFEERWCLKEFGDEYRDYMNKVGRYF